MTISGSIQVGAAAGSTVSTSAVFDPSGLILNQTKCLVRMYCIARITTAAAATRISQALDAALISNAGTPLHSSWPSVAAGYTTPGINDGNTNVRGYNGGNQAIESIWPNGEITIQANDACRFAFNAFDTFLGTETVTFFFQLTFVDPPSVSRYVDQNFS